MGKIVASLARMDTTIPFDEVLPGATVRFILIDGKQYLALRDFVMVYCDQTNKSAWTTWERLDQKVKDELKKFILSFQFPGQGRSAEPVIEFPGDCLSFPRGFRNLR